MNGAVTSTPVGKGPEEGLQEAREGETARRRTRGCEAGDAGRRARARTHPRGPQAQTAPAARAPCEVRAWPRPCSRRATMRAAEAAARIAWPPARPACRPACALVCPRLRARLRARPPPRPSSSLVSHHAALFARLCSPTSINNSLKLSFPPFSTVSARLAHLPVGVPAAWETAPARRGTCMHVSRLVGRGVSRDAE